VCPPLAIAAYRLELFPLRHAITLAAHRLDRVCFQLYAQPPDEDLNGVGIAVEVQGIDVFDHFAARNNLACPMHQELQHPQLKCGKLDDIAILRDSCRPSIELD